MIILTAHADDEARRRSREAGAVAFFGKPVRADGLLNAVKRVLGHDVR